MKARIFLALVAVLPACSIDEVPSVGRTPSGPGNHVRFDLYHRPLPEVPLPNDVAMWPDPTSRTGLRVNASVVAPTNIEETARKKFDTLEGWGTFSAITVSFDPSDPKDTRPAVDLENIAKRHNGDDYELDDDVIYLIDLETGVPAIIDLGEGAFQYTIREKNRYWRNDTRSLEQNLLFETADEAINPLTGEFDQDRTTYRPEFDMDFDGTLDRPNLLDPSGPAGNFGSCANQVDIERCKAEGTADCAALELGRDQCIGDQLLTFYERETNSLIMRPIVPLEEKRRYAVVVTDRAVDYDGRAVKSPFDLVFHPSQMTALEAVEDHLSNPKLASYYGSIGGTGLDHVAFGWSFTTQPVMEDLKLIRDGLYGKGVFAKLGKQIPNVPEMHRAAGRINAKQAANGAVEDADWFEQTGCEGRRERLYIVDVDIVKSTIRQLAEQGFGVSGAQLETLVAGFDEIKHFAIGSVKSPFFIQGGPQGEDPNASIELDFQDGEGAMAVDEVQFMLAIPKDRPGYEQPFPISMYGHGYTSGMVEHIGFAGELAKQGIASVGWNAVYHGIDLPETDRALATALFAGSCQAPFGDALFSGRQRDLNEDGVVDSGGDYWTSYLFHTRDVVRQSAIDSLQLFRVFQQFGTKKTNQDYDDDGDKDELLGDFDNDGRPDAGGPDVDYFAWGQSLGGILSPFAAALDPKVVAAAPTSGSGGLLDVGVRTFQGGAFEGIYLRNFGPLIAGVPQDSVDPTQTRCMPGQVSVRFVVLNVNADVEVEITCLDANEVTGENGGTVVVNNLDNGETRCARVDTAGRFRIGIPSNIGHRVEIQLYDQPDAVETYDPDAGCQIQGATRLSLIDHFGDGVMPEGTLDPKTEVVGCTEPRGCGQFQDQFFPAGSPLVSIAEGFGHIRQTPSLRRFMNLAGNIVDPGDPINMAPYFGLRPLLDPNGKLHPPKGLLNLVTIGDMNVPLNSGIAMARAAGALPFLRPDAAERYPAHADYVTPDALYASLGDRTPNRVLVDMHVLEGISRLERNPPDSCAPNEIPMTVEVTECHRACTMVGQRDNCQDGQLCNADMRCQAPTLAPESCRHYLADPDVVDEGEALHGELEASVPLRLARISRKTDVAGIEDVFSPRLRGVPNAPDGGAWSSDERIVASLAGYISPRGEHGYFIGNPCDNFSIDSYLINLTARFFASSGKDLFYLSHPSTHKCLARPTPGDACDFIVYAP